MRVGTIPLLGGSAYRRVLRGRLRYDAAFACLLAHLHGQGGGLFQCHLPPDDHAPQIARTGKQAGVSEFLFQTQAERFATRTLGESAGLDDEPIDVRVG